MRSEIAARWAAHLGYTNVKRFPQGYLGWLETHCEQITANTTPTDRPEAGDPFPEVKLSILEGKADRDYLGLEPDSREVTLEDIQTDTLAVIVFNTFCHECVQDIRLLNEFVQEARTPDTCSLRILRIVAIASGDNPHKVRRFRHAEKIAFPLFSDQDRILFRQLGIATLPVAYLLQRQADGTYTITDTHTGMLAEDSAFLQKLTRLSGRAP